MIINIPIQIDERILEEKAQKDFDDKITEAVYRHIEKAIMQKNGFMYYDRGTSDQKKIEDGMHILVRDRIDVYFEKHLDEIIDIAAERLEERLIRRKKFKEVAK